MNYCYSMYSLLHLLRLPKEQRQAEENKESDS